MMPKNRNNSASQLDEFYAPLFLGDRLIMHDICNALGLSSAKKDEFIKDYYKNDENKLIMWAKRIKRKCPNFFDSFIEIAELDDDLFNENINRKGKNRMIVKEESNIPFESKRDSKCPYWYIFKHGVGPGTIPDDVKIGKVKDLDNYYSIVWLDRPLSTQELKYYDIYPETMNMSILKNRLGYTDVEIDNLLSAKPVHAKKEYERNVIKGLGEKNMIIRERNKRPIKENAQSEFDKRLRDANRWYVKAFNDYENGALDNGGYLYYEVDGPYYGYEDDDNFIFILTMEDGYVDEHGNPIYAPELSVRVNKGEYFKDDNPIIDSTAAYYGDATESQAMIDSIYAYLNDKQKKYRGSNDNIPW